MGIASGVLDWIGRVPLLAALTLVTACVSTENGQIQPSALIGSAFEAGARARVVADGKPVENMATVPGPKDRTSQVTPLV